MASYERMGAPPPSSGGGGGGAGFGIGSLIAVVLSWDANHSIMWAIVHALLGWFYVLYRMCASACDGCF